MKTRNRFSFPAATLVAVALVLGLAGAALAADKPAAKPAEVTLTGDVQCAMCILKKADAKGCQDVLVVTDKAGKTEYYLVKNAVSEKFGMSCMKRAAGRRDRDRLREGRKEVADRVEAGGREGLRRTRAAGSLPRPSFSRVRQTERPTRSSRALPAPGRASAPASRRTRRTRRRGCARVSARYSAGAWPSVRIRWRSAASRIFVRQLWAKLRKNCWSPVQPVHDRRLACRRARGGRRRTPTARPATSAMFSLSVSLPLTARSGNGR